MNRFMNPADKLSSIASEPSKVLRCDTTITELTKACEKELNYSIMPPSKKAEMELNATKLSKLPEVTR